MWQEGTMRVVRPGLIPNCERCEVAAGRGRQRFMYPMNIVVQYKIGTQVRYNAVDAVAAIEPPTDIPCPVPIGSSSVNRRRSSDFVHTFCRGHVPSGGGARGAQALAGCVHDAHACT